MAWFKVDDGLHGHPKTRRAGLAAMGLWAVAAAYQAAYQLDGFVPAHYVVTWPSGRKLAGQLVAAGLWEPDTHPVEGAGWAFHDFNDYNPTVADWEAEKAAARERQRQSRARRRDPVTGKLGIVTRIKAGDES